MEQALLELVKNGLPLAGTAIKVYYFYWAVCAILISFTFLGCIGMGYHLVRRWQDYLMTRGGD